MIISIGGYYGGKHNLTPWLLSLVPVSFSNYIEPFCGFASLGLNIQSRNKTFSDLNPFTIAALKGLRDKCDQVILDLSTFEWSKDSFHQLKALMSTPDRCKPFAAIAFSAMAFQRGGSVSGFSPKQCDRAKKRSWEYLQKASLALQDVDIVCRPFDCSKPAHAKSFIYLDPPYLNGGEHYATPLRYEEHISMLQWAVSTKSKVMISGHKSELYQSYLHDWRTATKITRSNNRSAQYEIVWMNY